MHRITRTLHRLIPHRRPVRRYARWPGKPLGSPDIGVLPSPGDDDYPRFVKHMKASRRWERRKAKHLIKKTETTEKTEKVFSKKKPYSPMGAAPDQLPVPGDPEWPRSLENMKRAVEWDRFKREHLEKKTQAPEKTESEVTDTDQAKELRNTPIVGTSPESRILTKSDLARIIKIAKRNPRMGMELDIFSKSTPTDKNAGSDSLELEPRKAKQGGDKNRLSKETQAPEKTESELDEYLSQLTGVAPATTPIPGEPGWKFIVANAKRDRDNPPLSTEEFYRAARTPHPSEKTEEAKEPYNTLTGTAPDETPIPRDPDWSRMIEDLNRKRVFPSFASLELEKHMKKAPSTVSEPTDPGKKS